VNLTISPRSNIPIYQQLQDQLTQQILTGALPGGTKLPSIRYMAQELHISVITVKKAYEELERAGFINTAAARGSYVTDRNDKDLAKSQRKRIESLLAVAIQEATVLNVTEEEVHTIVERLYRDTEQSNRQ
jgi:GntR family transcriptional regulator